jgi:lysozyme family protein
MQYIHVKYLQPTDKLGGRYKISKEGLRSAIVPCLCYMESAYDCLKKFKEVNELDWSIEKMAWGTSRDGIVFCFPSSIGDFDRTFKHQ